MTDAPAHAMSAASLPSPAPTAPTEQGAASAANAANAPHGISVVKAVKAEDGIMQSTPIGPNCSLQSLRDGTYRMVSESSFQLIDRTMYDSLFQQYLIAGVHAPLTVLSSRNFTPDSSTTFSPSTQA